MKRFGKTTGPTKEELQDEAMAELRRTSAGAAPRRSERPLPPSPTPSERRIAAAPPARSTARRAEIAESRPDLDMDDPESSEEPLDDETPLTPEEERRAVTEFALLQLAEREGRQTVPEDLIFEPTDPFAAESARDVALERFFDQQAQRQHGDQRHMGQNMSTGNRREPQRASVDVKWTVGSRPRAVPQEEPTPARAAPPSRSAAKGAPAAKRTRAAKVVTATPAKAAPVAKRPAKATTAKATPAKATAVKRPAKATPAKATTAVKRPAKATPAKATTAPAKATTTVKRPAKATPAKASGQRPQTTVKRPATTTPAKKAATTVKRTTEATRPGAKTADRAPIRSRGTPRTDGKPS